MNHELLLRSVMRVDLASNKTLSSHIEYLLDLQTIPLVVVGVRGEASGDSARRKSCCRGARERYLPFLLICTLLCMTLAAMVRHASFSTFKLCS